MRIWSFLVLFAAALTIGCSSSPEYDTSTPEGGFKLGEKYEKDERYEEAITQFTQLKNKFPYSKLAPEAELKVADINYMREDYAEAQIAYQTFKDLHPTHPKSDYVTFRLAMSFFKQLPSTIDRDLSIAHKAILYFDEVVLSYSKSPFVAEAKETRQKAKQMLAEKEQYIANFYLKKEKWESALGRFEEILASYPASELEPKALLGAARSAYKMNDRTKTRGFIQRLLKEYPNSRETELALREFADARK